MGSKPTHILVIRLSAMGDVAMCVPVLRAFVKQNPSVKITVLSRTFFKPLFDAIENVNFYAVEVSGRHKGVLGLFRLYTELKTLKIDAIADVHNVLRSKILRFYFAYANMQHAVIDKGRLEKKALTRTENKKFQQLKTSHERYADVFRKLGFELDLSNPLFPKKRPLSEEIRKLTGTNYLKWIGIAPFAQYQSKMYPIDLLKKVISKLVATKHYKIFLFGGGQTEIALLDTLSANDKNIVNCAGKLKLKEELNLIAHLDGMLSMDSANSHLAAMQGVKTITLWGVTHPYAGFMPFNQPANQMVLPDLEKYPKLPCSIYGNKVIKGYEDVMRSISPEQVVDKIVDII